MACPTVSALAESSSGDKYQTEVQDGAKRDADACPSGDGVQRKRTGFAGPGCVGEHRASTQPFPGTRQRQQQCEL